MHVTLFKAIVAIFTVTILILLMRKTNRIAKRLSAAEKKIEYLNRKLNKEITDRENIEY